ncbi:MAG TPA: septum formation initiator family protein [Erysipelothrix sp.]|jgi:cell division protein FtsL|nr:septum formation initiator family protein [Erysipelothrix sp.]
MKKPLPARIGSTLVSILLVAISAFFIMNIVFSQIETRRLEGILSSKEEELAQLNRDQEELEKQKQKLSDPEYIKDYARGNFMLSEENEQIFILPSQGD